MHYILEKEFGTVMKSSFRVESPKGRMGETAEKASVSDVIHWLLSSYRPMPERRLVLDMNSLRRLNRVIDILEAEPENEHFAFEDADWETAKLVATTMAMMLSARNAPIIEDIFVDAPTSIGLRAVKEETASGNPE